MAGAVARTEPPIDHPSRKTKRGITLYLTDEEFDAVTKRAEKDGITKQEIGARLLLNYARRGLLPG